MADKKELSAKEERFCQEYIIDFKGTEAAIRAGYGEKSARTQAWRMLKKETIAARVRELLEEYNEQHCFREKSRFIRETWKRYEKAVEEGDGKTFTKCLEIIGKTNGFFSDTVEHRFGDGGVEINVKVAGDEDGC